MRENWLKGPWLMDETKFESRILFAELLTIFLTRAGVSTEYISATGRPLNSFTLRKLHARLGPTICALVADCDVRCPLDMWFRMALGKLRAL